MTWLIVTGLALTAISITNILIDTRDRFMVRVFGGFAVLGVAMVIVGAVMPQTARSIVAEASVVKGHDCLAMQRADTASPWACTQMEPEP